jgi:beta-lactam-binding protein with PASTA domain
LRSAFTNDEASEFDPGLVTAQDPAAGSEVEAGTVVRLRVATGVLVPNVVGSNPDDAQARARSSGLAATVTEVRTDAARSGTVFEQQPGAGQSVARGSTLQLSVARTPLAVVPNLIERTRAEATDAAGAVRLVVTFEEDRDSTLPPDRVTRQDPAAGVPVEIGTTMRVAVATGVAVPDVSGVPVGTARGRLEAAGLRAAEEREVTASRPESTVLRQSPEAPAVVARGSVVRLVVAAVQTVVPSQPAQTPATPTSIFDRLRTLNLTSILPALLGVGLFSLVVYRFVKANRGSLEEKEDGGEAPPAPDVALDPHAGDLVTRLEVSGAGLVDFEVRLRVGADSGQQSLAVDGPLLDGEKRIYE